MSRSFQEYEYITSKTVSKDGASEILYEYKQR